MLDDDLAFHVTLRERDLFTLPWALGGDLGPWGRRQVWLTLSEKLGFGSAVAE